MKFKKNTLGPGGPRCFHVNFEVGGYSLISVSLSSLPFLPNFAGYKSLWWEFFVVINQNKEPKLLLLFARGFWDRQSSAFFDVRVCHPNTESYKDLSPEQIYRQHENGKKRSYAKRVMEIEQGTFTPLVFLTTGGMAEECRRYHCRLAQLLAMKKGEHYSTAVAWVRAKVSFAILRSAILCLRGSRTIRRKNNLNINDIDMEIDKGQARMQ